MAYVIKYTADIASKLAYHFRESRPRDASAPPVTPAADFVSWLEDSGDVKLTRSADTWELTFESEKHCTLFLLKYS